MIAYTVEKRKRTRKVTYSLGWYLGRGYLRGIASGKFECWCVMHGSKIICDASSESCANKIADALNYMLHLDGG